jgi:peptidoglycan hydrolase CwlO-like protein
MDETQVITQTLNSTLQRYTKAVQGYEIEIANMTAEVLRLQAKVEELTKGNEEKLYTSES